MNLTAFQQSVFLQSLGWAIANSIWQGGMLWVLYQILVSSYNNASARFKHNASTVLLCSNFLWFIITFFSKIIFLRNNLPGGTESKLSYYSKGGVIPGNISIVNFIPTIGTTLPYLSLAYLLLLSVFAIKLVNSYRNTNFIRKNGLRKPDAEWRVFVEKVANHIGINKKIKIWFSKYVDVPATIGFLKPVILIPLASLNQLTACQMEAIILHEISHIQRNDYAINLIISLIETILFFNPFVVLLSKAIKKERENCCDDFVLQYQYDRHSYASALLVLERSREQQFHLALTATSGKKQLLIRIKRIMEVKKSNDGLNYGQKLLALLVSTAIICSIAWLTPQKKTDLPAGKPPLPGKLSLKTNKAYTQTSIKLNSLSQPSPYKEPKKINLILKPALVKEKSYNIESPSNASDEESNNADVIQDNAGEDNISAWADYNADLNNKAIALKNKTALSRLNAVSDDIIFSPEVLLSNLNFMKDLYFDIDISKLKNDFEKEKIKVSVDWANLKDQVKENLEKATLTTSATIAFEKDKVKLVRQQKEFNENLQKHLQWQKLKSVVEAKGTWAMPSLRDDSSNFTDAYEGNAYFYNESGENLPPLPQPILKAPNPPPGEISTTIYKPSKSRYEYSFKYSAPPKPKLPPSPAIHIDYKQRVIVINGEKINPAPPINARVERSSVRKVGNRDNKHIVTIESGD